MKVFFDIVDVHGSQIIKSGQKLTQKRSDTILSRGAKFRFESVSLNRVDVTREAEKIMRERINKKIFNTQTARQKILRIIRNTHIPLATLQEVLPLKKKSAYNFRHSLLIGMLAARLAIDLKKKSIRPEKAFLYGFLHDLGKTRIPPKILNKKTRLTHEEHKLLQQHPVISYVLLLYYLGETHKDACRVGLEHHEKLDGTGYPRGVHKLGPYTQLISVIDVFDALVAKRPYRKRPFTIRHAIDKLLGESYAGRIPKQPILLLVRYFRQKSEYLAKMKVSKIPRKLEPTGSLYGKILPPKRSSAR